MTNLNGLLFCTNEVSSCFEASLIESLFSCSTLLFLGIVPISTSLETLSVSVACFRSNFRDGLFKQTGDLFLYGLPM